MMKGVKMSSRKYYIMLARVIKDSTVKHNGKMLPTINKTTLVSDLCIELGKDNELFSPVRFINACCDDS